jgi:glycopeptide antibiotics resistance protein
MKGLPFPSAKARPVLGASHYAWLALGVFVLAVYGSLIPLHFQPRSLGEAGAVFQGITLLDPSDLGARADWVISVGLFTVLSYLLVATLAVDRPWSVGLVAALAVVPACVALSVVIEFVQVFFPPRTVSLNDIAVESAGGLAGALAWLLGGQHLTKWMRRVWSETGVAGLARNLLPGYLVLVAVVQLLPFDFVVGRAELAAKYAEGKILLVPFQQQPAEGMVALLGKLFANAACFFPLGFLRVLAAGRRPASPGGGLRVFALGLGVASLVEFGQLFVYSRYFDTTDLLTGTAGVLFGWWSGHAFWNSLSETASRPGMFLPAAPASRPRLAGLFGVCLLAWLAAVVYFNWQPFDFTANPAPWAGDTDELAATGGVRVVWLPLTEYYWGSKYNALDQFLRKMVSFLPLGVLFALRLRSLYQPGAVWPMLLVALVAAVVLEAGQYFLPARVASVTDVLLECGGAWIGFKVTRHLRALLWAERTLYGYLYQFGR